MSASKHEGVSFLNTRASSTTVVNARMLQPRRSILASHLRKTDGLSSSACFTDNSAKNSLFVVKLCKKPQKVTKKNKLVLDFWIRTCYPDGNRLSLLPVPVSPDGLMQAIGAPTRARTRRSFSAVGVGLPRLVCDNCHLRLCLVPCRVFSRKGEK